MVRRGIFRLRFPRDATGFREMRAILLSRKSCLFPTRRIQTDLAENT